jgi:hypothetical protein
MTRTVSPDRTDAVLSTAPTPVCTAQPTTQATSRGTSWGIRTAPVAWMITTSAKAATPMPRWTTSPPRLRRVPPSGWVLVIIESLLAHRLHSPRTHQ